VSTPLASAPLWFRAARALVRRLPAGRFRAFNLMARTPLPPFEDRLGPEAGRLRYRCDLRHLIARETCLTGRYAPLEGALVRTSLGVGDTFVDVGANFGYFTLMAAAEVGRAGRVVAVEPDPRMVAELAANVALNALDRVTVVAAVASDRAGTVRLSGFREEGGNWGVSSIVAAVDGGVSMDVPCAPLDTLLDRADVDGVALVKVDVEGAEGRVLAGMREGLRRRRYRRVMVELHPWLLGDYAAFWREVDGAMRAAGYRAWLLDGSSAAVRRTFYGAPPVPRLDPVHLLPEGEWPHVLWAAPGAEPS
jgi:FkbM family methyltransferase